MLSVEIPQAEPQVSATTLNPSAVQALKARSLRISVLPIRVDGSKRTTRNNWKQYQKRLATTELEGDWTFLGNGVQ